jgi:hypothetical protein
MRQKVVTEVKPFICQNLLSAANFAILIGHLGCVVAANLAFSSAYAAELPFAGISL